MKTQDEFKAATKLFYSCCYQQGVSEINKCLKQQPQNSILYSNRALFAFQLGRKAEALQDLELALKHNNMNFMAYFNIFSIIIKQPNNYKDLYQAFNNLLCSLSCLYLIRAKINHSLSDVRMARDYAPNNLQAIIYQVLSSTKMANFQQALTVINQSSSYFPENSFLMKIKNRVQSLKDQEKNESKRDTMKSIIGRQELQGQRLNSFHQVIDQIEISEKIQQKLVEFNLIYNDLNTKIGTIAYLVPKHEKNINTSDTYLNAKPVSNHYKLQIGEENEQRG